MRRGPPNGENGWYSGNRFVRAFRAVTAAVVVAVGLWDVAGLVLATPCEVAFSGENRDTTFSTCTVYAICDGVAIRDASVAGRSTSRRRGGSNTRACPQPGGHVLTSPLWPDIDVLGPLGQLRMPSVTFFVLIAVLCAWAILELPFGEWVRWARSTEPDE
jgi:hypothetical protein